MAKDTDITNKRPKRVPLHEQKRNILTVSNRDPNYHYRWVNLTGTRVESFKEADYEIVEHDAQVGDVNRNVSLGSGARTPVGGGTNAVLMRIRKDLFEADQKDKQTKIKREEDLMIRKTKPTESGEDGTYGEVSIGNKP
jgi:hypothetical protein